MMERNFGPIARQRPRANLDERLQGLRELLGLPPWTAADAWTMTVCQAAQGARRGRGLSMIPPLRDGVSTYEVSTPVVYPPAHGTPHAEGHHGRPTSDRRQVGGEG